ncbi:hypothetical protein ACFPIJ_16150 [Dactylosporangium cerinum]|uniref:Uncharacterized protein n=1 Tax=Dactylosporangium cerinum TaxID=1434730 RepID=A0ABV9VU81_9ACTN
MGRQDYGHAEIGWLAGQLGVRGATGALEPLTAALAHENTHERVFGSQLCRAIGEIGGTGSAVDEVRTCFERGFRPYERGQAAFALWQLTGDPLLRLVEANLVADDREHDTFLLSLLPSMGEAARPLLPALRAHLQRFPQRLGSNTRIADILYTMDGDSDEIVPPLAADLTKRMPSEQAFDLVEQAGLTALLPHLRNVYDGTSIEWVKVRAAGARHRSATWPPTRWCGPCCPHPPASSTGSTTPRPGPSPWSCACTRPRPPSGWRRSWPPTEASGSVA